MRDKTLPRDFQFQTAFHSRQAKKAILASISFITKSSSEKLSSLPMAELRTVPYSVYWMKTRFTVNIKVV